MKMSPRLQMLASYFALSCLVSLVASAAPIAKLAVDLQPGPPLEGGASSWPSQFTIVGDQAFFFTASTTPTGRAGGNLWVTQGTPETTRSLESFPSLVVAQTGDLLYYLEATTDPGSSSGEFQLWRTDGTGAGSFPLVSSIQRLFDGRLETALVGETLYFFRNYSEVWRTDGTPDTTRQVVELDGLSKMLAFDDELVLFSNGEIWATDGTEAGTRRIGEDWNLSDSRNGVLSGDRLYFFGTATDASESQDLLWVLRDLSSAPSPVTTVESLASSFLFSDDRGGVLYLAQQPDQGQELWKVTKDAASPRRLTNLEPEAPFRDFGRDFWIRTDGWTTWFLASAPEDYRPTELWSVGQTVAGQRRLFPSCATRYCYLNSDSIQSFGDYFAFSGREDPDDDEKFFIVDKKGMQLRALRELCAPQCADAISQIQAIGDQIFFISRSDFGISHLFRSDGTREGTFFLGAYRTERSSQALLSGGVKAPFGWILGFFTDATGHEPWILGNEADRLTLLRDIDLGREDLHLRQVQRVGSEVFFYGERSEEDGSFRTQPSIFRLTEDGNLLRQLELNESEDAEILSTGDQGLIFRGTSYSGGEIYGIGTTAGDNQLLATIQGHAQEAVSWEDKTFFLVREGIDLGLWVTDGTAAGTGRVFDPAGHNLSTFYGLRWTSEGLLFGTNTGSGSRTSSLWLSDGTAAGTRQLKDLSSDSVPQYSSLGVPLERVDGIYLLSCSSYSQELVRILPNSSEFHRVGSAGDCGGNQNPGHLIEQPDGIIFISGGSGSRRHLWILSDDDPLPRPLLEAEASVREQPSMVEAFGLAFFPFFEEQTGLELWRSDGTLEGSWPLKNVRSGFASSDPDNLTLAADRLYFTASDGAHGRELWVTDGTEAGTRLVHDIYPGAQSSEPEELTVVDDRLYFIADDGLIGRELWVLPLDDSGPACKASEEALCLRRDRFQVEARWRDLRDRTGTGKAVSLTGDTGYFWFFNEENVELVTKILDGNTFNDHFWTFYGALSNVEYWLTVTDTETGLTRRYFNPSTSFASVGDTRSFGPKGASLEFSPDPATPPHGLGLGLATEVASFQVALAALTACAPSSERLCLGGGRFAAEVSWTDFQGNTGAGIAGDLTDDTGTFWFFQDTNIELILKVVDGRANNGHFWVFYGSLSNVDFDLTVTDRETGLVKVYRNRSRQFASVGDTKAF